VASRSRRGREVTGADGDDVVAVDDGPGVVDGDQPVGVAVEGQAGVGPSATTSRRFSGWVAPQRSLMLQPSGWSLMTMTSAPRRWKAAGRPAGGAVGAVEHEREAVEAVAGQDAGQCST
jgi:hypothetical protein